jgi:succinate dehydrogenase / fumarate reductase, membrane anchor subunit
VKAYTKNPVGAHYGLRDWLLQRLTAVVMGLFTIGFIVCLVWHAPATHADWKAIFSGTFVRLATMLFFASLLYHAWVGMRDIFMDYVKPVYPRLALQTIVGLVLITYLVWAASILFGAPR